MKTNESNLLASVSILRNLCNNSKDLYDVISAFVIHFFIDKKGAALSLAEIREGVCEKYNFQLPEGVFKASIKNRLKDYIVINSQGKYEQVKEFDNVKPLESNEIDDVNELIEDLSLYIEEKEKHSISHSDLLEKLKEYLLNDNCESSFSQMMSFYVLERGKTKIKETLNLIKQGFILYFGIKASPVIDQNLNWPCNLTIFLDTEIIFDLAGYNGLICQSIVEELLKLITELNANDRTNKQRIKLRYFNQTQAIIEHFFNDAKKRKSSPSSNVLSRPSTAMNFILSNTNDAAGVVSMMSNLKLELKKRNILECDDCKEQIFEITQNERVREEKENYLHLNEQIVDENFFDYKVEQSIDMLSMINTLRNGKSDKGFEKTENILLTRKSITKFFASVYKGESKDVPLATSISFLSNKFWFKLNKGFGGNNVCPLNADVLICAKQIISSQINEKITEDYNRIKKQYQNKEITEEQLASLYSTLRSQDTKLDDIDEHNIEDIKTYITQDMLESYHQAEQKKNKMIKDGIEAKEKNKSAKKKIFEEKVSKIRRKTVFFYYCIKILLEFFSILLFLVSEYILIWIAGLAKFDESIAGIAAEQIIPLIIGVVYLYFVAKNKRMNDKINLFITDYYRKKMYQEKKQIAEYFL